MTRQQVLDLYFLDARHKLIEIAAFLDRVERSSGKDDFRLKSFRSAVKELSGGKKQKANAFNSFSATRRPSRWRRRRVKGRAELPRENESATTNAMTTKAQDIKISELKGFEQVAAMIGDRPLFHFNFVRSFRYFVCCEDDLGGQWSDIELVMEELTAPHAKVGIRFHRVSVDSFSGFGQIMGLYFQSIQERGWERLRFEIGDYEDGHIHLFCHEISLFDPRKAA